MKCENSSDTMVKFVIKIFQNFQIWWMLEEAELLKYVSPPC